jgi:hypothetical protein
MIDDSTVSVDEINYITIKLNRFKGEKEIVGALDSKKSIPT